MRSAGEVRGLVRKGENYQDCDDFVKIISHKMYHAAIRGDSCMTCPWLRPMKQEYLELLTSLGYKYEVFEDSIFISWSD